MRLKSLIVACIICVLATTAGAQTFIGGPLRPEGPLFRSNYLFDTHVKGKVKGKVGLTAGGGGGDPFTPNMPTGIAQDGSGTAVDTEYPNTSGYVMWLVCTDDCHNNTKIEGGTYDRTYCPFAACTVNTTGLDKLQKPFDDAMGLSTGVVVRLKEGQTFTGLSTSGSDTNFHLPKRNVADASHWGIVQSSNCDNAGACADVPAQHTRVCNNAPYTSVLMNAWSGCPEAPHMATIKPSAWPTGAMLSIKRGTGNNSKAADDNSAFWRIGPGIELTTAGVAIPNAQGYVGVAIGDDAETDITHSPDHIVFDRIYEHGAPHGSTGENMNYCAYWNNGRSLALIDSYLGDCHMLGASESYGLLVLGVKGPAKIVNNRLDAAGVNMFIGGAYLEKYTDKSWGLNSDIEVRNNSFWKNWPTWAGIGMAVKNEFEIKFGHRILVEGNIFQYTWAEAQWGAIVLKSTSEDGSCTERCFSTDITVRYNWGKHLSDFLAGMGAGNQENFVGGFQHGIPIANPAYNPQRIWIHDNLAQDVMVNDYYVAPGGWSLGYFDGTTFANSQFGTYQGRNSYERIQHNTFMHAKSPLLTAVGGTKCDRNRASQQCMDHFAMTDNLTVSAVRNIPGTDNYVYDDSGLTSPFEDHVRYGGNTVADAAIDPICTSLDAKTTPLANISGCAYWSNIHGIIAGETSDVRGTDVTQNIGSCGGHTCSVESASIGFVNYSQCNTAVSMSACALANATPYKGASTDCAARTALGLSCDIGADITQLGIKTACSMTGINCR